MPADRKPKVIHWVNAKAFLGSWGLVSAWYLPQKTKNMLGEHEKKTA
jgi:hypothetical protein